VVRVELGPKEPRMHQYARASLGLKMMSFLLLASFSSADRRSLLLDVFELATLDERIRRLKIG